MAGLLPIRPRATWAVAMLAVIIALDVVYAIVVLMQADLLTRIVEGAPFTKEEAMANTVRVAWVSIGHLAAFIGCIVTFLLWFHRAVARADVQDLTPSISPSAAVWSFFIPFLNLYRPYQIMKAIWQASAPPAGRGRQPGSILPLSLSAR